MPDPIIDNNQPNNPPAPPATPADNGGSPDINTIDFSTLTEDQLAKVYENPNLFKHPRFKELSEAKQELGRLKAEAKTKAEADLVEQKKFEELAESRAKENETLKSQLETQRIDGAIERAALRTGAQDSEAVLKLIDRTNIKLDSTGTISGVDEAIKSLSEGKAYLFGKGTDLNIGSGANPGEANTNLKRFKMSQLQDATFYRANQADIEASMRAGLVENDLQQ